VRLVGPKCMVFVVYWTQVGPKFLHFGCTLGVYGTKGVAFANNIPGPRDSAVSWTDTSGNIVVRW
jgi:hypothetical protein